MFVNSLGAVADVQLAIRSKNIQDDVMVVSGCGEWVWSCERYRDGDWVWWMGVVSGCGEWVCSCGRYHDVNWVW